MSEQIEEAKQWKKEEKDRLRTYRRGGESHKRTLERLKQKRQSEEGREKYNAEQRASFLRRKEREAGRPRPSACEICQAMGRRIMFDHNHDTSIFRGWICHNCNVIIGHADDKPELLEQIARYLRRA